MVEEGYIDPIMRLELRRVLDETYDWFSAWWTAWDMLAELGQCDSIGGAEYRRVTAEARLVGVGNSQVEMRRFIRERVNLGPVQSETERSLLRRANRLKEKYLGVSDE